MEQTSLEGFYQELGAHIPEGISKEIGHFNVFDTAALMAGAKGASVMPYNRRAYYKISLIRGRNRAEYADKIIDIERNALLFATPKVPYHWVSQGSEQAGHFCIFTESFLTRNTSSLILDNLPIFRPGGYPVFQLPDEASEEIAAIFRKMHSELASEYAYKYDLLRNYVMELIHYGQKLQPVTALYPTQNAGGRVTALFVELLERQFPIESPQQRLQLRTAKDYADRLAVHVNHLNKVLRENTGNTTTALISGRLLQEAKILLRQTDWSVSEIAYSLGFEEVAHFSNFFKKQTALSPLAFRN